MGSYVIKMPDIGEGIAQVELVAWHVKPGDSVAEDQPLADVMTDKATVEIPSPVSGTVHSLGGAIGQQMAVGSELIRLEVAGAGNVGANAAQKPQQAAETRPPVQAAALTPTSEPASTPTSTPTPAATSVSAPTPARTHVPAPAPIASGRVDQELAAAARAADSPANRPLASPSVRQHARNLDIDLWQVRGSGPGGRITHEDLESLAAWRQEQEQQARQAAQRAASGGLARREGEQQIPVIGLRRVIAQKMQEAKRRIPHFTYVEEVDVTELEALRQQLNARHASAHGKLTLLPFIARALVLVLRDFPQMNARFDDDAGVVTRFSPVHLGIATQTGAGLMVPVLRHAEAMDLWACAANIAQLAEAARTAKATREQLSGSTITITSLGALGGIVTTPVINHPEVAILGINRIVERPMFRSAAVVPRMLMNLSSSFDHRVIDGLDAAEFIQAIRALLETPAMLFVEPARVA